MVEAFGEIDNRMHLVYILFTSLPRAWKVVLHWKAG